jgi:2-keto-3-deoxy-L-rhamnonate aldolase RhmA
VDDAETAARLASYCRYPRDGTRSIAGVLPQLDFRTIPIAEATRALNQATQVVVMVETGRAIRNVESIAAARGIDVILVGTNDLCLDLGIPGQLDHPEVIQALERVVAACRKHGVHPGLGGIYQPPLMQRCIEMGFRWITTGSDLAFLLQGARQQAETVRAMYRG